MADGRLLVLDLLSAGCYPLPAICYLPFAICSSPLLFLRVPHVLIGQPVCRPGTRPGTRQTCPSPCFRIAGMSLRKRRLWIVTKSGRASRPP